MSSSLPPRPHTGSRDPADPAISMLRLLVRGGAAPAGSPFPLPLPPASAGGKPPYTPAWAWPGCPKPSGCMLTMPGLGQLLDVLAAAAVGRGLRGAAELHARELFEAEVRRRGVGRELRGLEGLELEAARGPDRVLAPLVRVDLDVRHPLRHAPGHRRRLTCGLRRPERHALGRTLLLRPRPAPADVQGALGARHARSARLRASVVGNRWRASVMGKRGRGPGTASRAGGLRSGSRPRPSQRAAAGTAPARRPLRPCTPRSRRGGGGQAELHARGCALARAPPARGRAVRGADARDCEDCDRGAGHGRVGGRERVEGPRGVHGRRGHVRLDRGRAAVGVDGVQVGGAARRGDRDPPGVDAERNVLDRAARHAADQLVEVLGGRRGRAA
eukprot:2073736-Rhodomonas_salina.1